MGIEDGDSNIWEVCGDSSDGTRRVVRKGCGADCNDGFLCPNSTGVTQVVWLDNPCNGVESCKKGTENKVCRISRDFPDIDSSLLINDIIIVDFCSMMNIHESKCEKKEFYGLTGKTFGVNQTLRGDWSKPSSPNDPTGS